MLFKYKLKIKRKYISDLCYFLMNRKLNCRRSVLRIKSIIVVLCCETNKKK